MARPKLTVASEMAVISTLVVILLPEISKWLPDGWLPSWFTPSRDTVTLVALLGLLAVIGLGLWRLRRLEAGLQAAASGKRLAELEQRLLDVINRTGEAINQRISGVEREVAGASKTFDKHIAALDAAAKEEYASAIRRAGGADVALAALGDVGETPAYKFAKQMVDSEGPKRTG